MPTQTTDRGTAHRRIQAQGILGGVQVISHPGCGRPHAGAEPARFRLTRCGATRALPTLLRHTPLTDVLKPEAARPAERSARWCS